MPGTNSSTSASSASVNGGAPTIGSPLASVGAPSTSAVLFKSPVIVSIAEYVNVPPGNNKASELPALATSNTTGTAMSASVTTTLAILVLPVFVTWKQYVTAAPVTSVTNSFDALSKVLAAHNAESAPANTSLII